MTTKLELPTLAGTLDASTISNWLNLCADSFEAFSLMNPTRTIDDSLRILLAGLKMEAPAAATWWNENRDSLKALTTWAAFSTAVKDRFVPANWRMDALQTFYAISQGSSSFLLGDTQFRRLQLRQPRNTFRLTVANSVTPS
jgi:hypothetical protein